MFMVNMNNHNHQIVIGIVNVLFLIKYDNTNIPPGIYLTNDHIVHEYLLPMYLENYKSLLSDSKRSKKFDIIRTAWYIV